MGTALEISNNMANMAQLEGLIVLEPLPKMVIILITTI